MNTREVLVIYVHELRSALRERNIVINSILLPIFLYPVMFWIGMTGMIFVMGQTEGFVSRIAVTDMPLAHERLGTDFAENKKIQLKDAGADESDLAMEIREGRLDALVNLVPPHDDDGLLLDANFEAEVIYDGSRDRSKKARERIVSTVRKYWSEWVREEAAEIGVTDDEWQQFELKQENLATESQMGAFVMGMLLPMLLMIMVALGCFNPAIDATAGEKERGTWETLMTVAARRSSIITGKYLYVATMGAIAGFLNVTVMVFTMRSLFAPLFQGNGPVMRFDLTLGSVPVIVAGTVLFALFAAAAMMIFASFARTFKEGQSMITPFYLMIILPVFLFQQPDVEFTPLLASIPVANVMLVFREAISGRYDVPLFALCLAVEIVTIVLCIWLASFLMRFEDVLVGSYEGSMWKFLRQRFGRNRDG